MWVGIYGMAVCFVGEVDLRNKRVWNQPSSGTQVAEHHLPEITVHFQSQDDFCVAAFIMSTITKGGGKEGGGGGGWW